MHLDRRRWLTTVAVAAASLAATCPAPAQTSATKKPAPLVVVPGRTVAMDVVGGQAVERIGIQVATGVKRGDLSVRVSRAAHLSSRRGTLADAFQAELVPQGKRPDAVQLTASTANLQRPGTFRVTLRFSDWRHGRVTPIALKVVVGPARLSVPTRVDLKRTVGVGSGSGPADGALSVRNASRHTWLSGLAATLAEGPTMDGKPAHGTIEFKELTLKPGGRGTIEATTDDLAVGTTSGVVELDAPELQRPLKVPFTIVTSRPDWYIFVVVVLGLLLGAITRSLLGVVERQQRARAAARWLRESLERERDAAPPDSRLRAGLQAALDAVPEPKFLATARAIGATMSTATELRKAAFDHYTAEHDRLRAAIEARRGEVTRHSSIGGVDAEWAAARQALEAATEALVGRDVGQADDDLTATDEALAHVVTAVATWSEAARRVAEAIGTSEATEGLDNRAGAVQAVLTALELVPPGAQAGATAAARAAQATESAEGALVAVRPLFGSARARTRARLEELRRRVTVGGGDDMAADLRNIAELDKAIRDCSWVDAAGAKAYEDALTSAGQLVSDIESRYAAPSAAPTTLGEGSAAGAAAAGDATAGAVTAVTAAGAAPGAPLAAPAQAEQPTTIEAPDFIGWVALLAAGVIRFVVLLLVLGAVGYFIFIDNFSGTTKELVNIGIWAFFTDVAVSSVDALRGRLPGLPAASTST